MGGGERETAAARCAHVTERDRETEREGERESDSRFVRARVGESERERETAAARWAQGTERQTGREGGRVKVRIFVRE